MGDCIELSMSEFQFSSSKDSAEPAAATGELRLRAKSSAEVWLIAIGAGTVVATFALAVQWFVYEYLLHETELHFVGGTGRSVPRGSLTAESSANPPRCVAKLIPQSVS